MKEKLALFGGPKTVTLERPPYPVIGHEEVSAAVRVVMSREYLEGLLGGEKRIEARLTKTRRAPFGRIGRGDRLFFKVSSGLVI